MADPVSASVLSAIAHPYRLTLLVAVERGAATTAALATATKTSEATVEQALAVLIDAGLVAAKGAAARRRFVTTGRGWSSVAGALIALDRASRAPGDDAATGDADPAS